MNFRRLMRLTLVECSKKGNRVDWILQYGKLISALTGVGTLIVWVVYLQIFVSSYRRQLHATMLITRGAHEAEATRCLVSNMSAAPIYVQSVLVTLETEGGSIVTPATDIVDMGDDIGESSLAETRQGPLDPGQVKDIGSFHSLISRGLRQENLDLSDVRAVLVEVVAAYASEDLPIGARRRFVVLDDAGGLRLQGDTIQTTQVRKRRERRKLLQDLGRDR